MTSTGTQWNNSDLHSNGSRGPTKLTRKSAATLSQDIHFQLWRSFQRYDGRCSLRTWIYRIAHHLAASHVIRERRIFSALVSLEELEMFPDKAEGSCAAERRLDLDRLSALIQ